MDDENKTEDHQIARTPNNARMKNRDRSKARSPERTESSSTIATGQKMKSSMLIHGGKRRAKMIFPEKQNASNFAKVY